MSSSASCLYMVNDASGSYCPRVRPFFSADVPRIRTGLEPVLVGDALDALDGHAVDVELNGREVVSDAVNERVDCAHGY
jgi:hypothetical protein